MEEPSKLWGGNVGMEMWVVCPHISFMNFPGYGTGFSLLFSGRVPRLVEFRLVIVKIGPKPQETKGNDDNQQ